MKHKTESWRFGVRLRASEQLSLSSSATTLRSISFEPLAFQMQLRMLTHSCLVHNKTTQVDRQVFDSLWTRLVNGPEIFGFCTLLAGRREPSGGYSEAIARRAS